jgi:ribonuclease VapC
MFIETSAFVCILLRDKEIDKVIDKIAKASRRVTGAHVRLEACMVVSMRLSISVADAELRFQAILDEAEIWVEPFTDELCRIAVSAFNRFGKGRKSKAKLNFGDCMSYAFAKDMDIPLLHVGSDFTHTDIKRA